MLPTVQIGPLSISTYAALQATAFIVAGMFSFHRLLTGGIPVQHATRGLFLSTLSGIAGAFLLGSLNGLVSGLVVSGRIAWRGGSTFIGGLIGGFGFGWLYCRRYGITPGRALDRIGLPLALGQAVGRVGCFCAGCCYGKATDAWLGMYLRDSHGDWLVRYPTQLMSVGIDLLIALVLWALEQYGAQQRSISESGSWPFPGFLFLFYVQLYAVKRFALAFLRGDARPILGPFALTHFLSLGGLLLVTTLMVRGLASRRRRLT